MVRSLDFWKGGWMGFKGDSTVLSDVKRARMRKSRLWTFRMG